VRNNIPRKEGLLVIGGTAGVTGTRHGGRTGTLGTGALVQAFCKQTLDLARWCAEEVLWKGGARHAARGKCSEVFKCGRCLLLAVDSRDGSEEGVAKAPGR